MPAMVVNCFSSGVATEDAIVSGLAPGRFALTWMVGKSTFGRSLTGRSRYAITPKTMIPRTISVVATGRRMNSAATFMVPSARASGRRRRRLEADLRARHEPQLPVGDDGF